MKEEDAPNCVRTDDGKKDNEFLVTRHSQFMIPINVINVYGQQECRISKETIEKHWEELLDIVNKIEARNELLVMVGDFNRNLGLNPEKEDKPSYGGQLVNEFLDSGKYILMNNSKKTLGGPWTRINPANKDNRSVLDLVIISAELEKHMESMVIDNKRSPKRVMTLNILIIMPLS